MDRNLDNPLWVERYRPRKIANMVLPSFLKKTFQGMVDAKDLPNLILAGGPGMGKTTSALAMLEEIGADFYKLNGSLDGNIDTLRTRVLDFATTVSFVGGRKYIFLDEADYLTYATQPPLRGIIEDVSSNCGFIFSVNYPERMIEPLRSRCSVVEFKIPSNEAQALKLEFYKRVSNILALETVEFDKKVLAQIVEKFFPDLRKILNELQRYSNSGPIDAGILAVIKDATLEELINAMKDRNFTAARRWVGENLSVGSTALFRKLYDSARDFVTPESVPLLITTIGEYQYRAAFVADPEINMAACVAEVMASCTFK